VPMYQTDKAIGSTTIINIKKTTIAISLLEIVDFDKLSFLIFVIFYFIPIVCPFFQAREITNTTTNKNNNDIAQAKASFVRFIGVAISSIC
jgi:hypothetical protein